jgi:hypothetical protein
VKYFRIGLTIGFLAFALICLIDKCNAEEYRVDSFIGGINVATDSTDLLPNQALNLTNLTFDMPNVLTSREGYSYWNSTAFNGVEGQEIDAITIYNDRIMSVVNGWPFANESHFQWTGDSLVVFNDSDFVYDIGDPEWLYMKAGYGDTIIISGVKYEVANVATSDDSTIQLSTNYAGSDDTIASYIYRKYLGSFDFFTEYGGILYFLSDDDYAGFTMVFNDTLLKYLAIIDTGTITSSIDFDTSSYIARGSDVVLKVGERKAVARSAGIFDSMGISIGDIFFYYYKYSCRRGRDRGKGGGYIIRDGTFYSTITAIDTAATNEWIEIEDVFRTPCGDPVLEANSWEVRREHTVAVVDSLYDGFADGSKNWFDIEFGNELYTRFYAVTADSGYDAIKNILNNDDTTLVLEGAVASGVNYYIMTMIPSYLLRGGSAIDSIYKEQPRFKQMIFYNGQYYAIGTYENKEPGPFPNPFDGTLEVYLPRYDRIWYSHPGFPGYANRTYFFELETGGVTSVLFTLRDRLYVGMTTSIWSSVGLPQIVNDRGDQIIVKVVSNNGIPDIDNWAKSTEEYGYYTNKTGTYGFDGVRPQEISLLIDPIIENNYSSRIVMVYQNPHLYISFTDSNFTLVYDERFKTFTKFDFGMTCAYAPPDSDIIYFGLNGQPGRIYYYPNGEYWDRNSSTDSSGIEIEYKSGWQSYGGYWLNKRITEGYFPMLTPDTASVSIYSNFSGTADDVITADSASRFVYRKDADNDATGEYFQIAIRDTVYNQAIIGGYRIIWEQISQEKK